MKIYADTSVFSGIDDARFAQASAEFFTFVETGRCQLVASAIVRREIGGAPARIREFYRDITGNAEHHDLTPETETLRDAYLAAGIVTENASTDAAHVAMATTLNCKAIVSWNFKHIANPAKAHRYNDINRANGYNRIDILRPSQVTTMTITESEAERYDQPEPDCVRWKRIWARPLNEKLARMTPEEELAFWREAGERARRERDEYKRRLPELERKLGVKRGHPEFISRLIALHKIEPHEIEEHNRMLEEEYRKLDAQDDADAAWLAWQGPGRCDKA